MPAGGAEQEPAGPAASAGTVGTGSIRAGGDRSGPALPTGPAVADQLGRPSIATCATVTTDQAFEARPAGSADATLTDEHGGAAGTAVPAVAASTEAGNDESAGSALSPGPAVAEPGDTTGATHAAIATVAGGGMRIGLPAGPALPADPAIAEQPAGTTGTTNATIRGGATAVVGSPCSALPAGPAITEQPADTTNAAGAGRASARCVAKTGSAGPACAAVAVQPTAAPAGPAGPAGDASTGTGPTVPTRPTIAD